MSLLGFVVGEGDDFKHVGSEEQVSKLQAPSRLQFVIPDPQRTDFCTFALGSNIQVQEDCYVHSVRKFCG
jgi:hypothetical protein